jgi:hypothetical protein
MALFYDERLPVPVFFFQTLKGNKNGFVKKLID